MHRSTRFITVAACATLGPAAAAQAGTVTLDKPCYTPGSPIVVTGAGFTPSTGVTLTGDGVFGQATTDPTGAFQAPVAAPPTGNTGAKPSDVATWTLTVNDPASPVNNAAAQYQVANFAADRGKPRDPRTVRKWYFSGFPTGSTVYAHFRYKGKTVSNYRMGQAAGPCGLLSKRAPGIPGHVHTGTYTLQIDTRKTYSKATEPKLGGTIRVFLVRR
jgi:hypothetical protein